MRIRLAEQDLTRLFAHLERQSLNTKHIANLVNVHPRTVNDWKRGKYTIPKTKLHKMIEVAGLDVDKLKVTVLDEWWSTSKAGKKGGLAAFNRYGPLGTTKSRKLGGVRSYNTRRNEINGIFSPNIINRPEHNELLAELIGILIGDGGVTKYQVVVATNSEDDHEYSLFVAQLFEELFNLKPTLTKLKNAKCITIVNSSIELVRFLKLQGVCQGSKLKQNLNIPAWILENNNYSKACLRGIFDTDGCIFQERHIIKGVLYSYPRLSFVSMSGPLRLSIAKVLSDLEFSPKIRNNRSVNLESRSDIERYFGVIGTSNPKHLNRFVKFGGVA